MGAIMSQITGVSIVYSTACSGAHQRKHQRSASLAFVWWPANSPNKGSVMQKMFPFDDVIVCDPIIARSITWNIFTRGAHARPCGPSIVFCERTSWPMFSLCIPTAFITTFAKPISFNRNTHYDLYRSEWVCVNRTTSKFHLSCTSSVVLWHRHEIGN